MQNYVPALPHDDASLWAWIVGLTIGHTVLNYVCKRLTGQSPFSDEAAAAMLPRIFNGLTFGTSVMLLVGFYRPMVTDLLGSQKPFLAIAGLAGSVSSIVSLGRKD